MDSARKQRNLSFRQRVADQASKNGSKKSGKIEKPQTIKAQGAGHPQNKEDTK